MTKVRKFDIENLQAEVFIINGELKKIIKRHNFKNLDTLLLHWKNVNLSKDEKKWIIQGENLWHLANADEPEQSSIYDLLDIIYELRQEVKALKEDLGLVEEENKEPEQLPLWEDNTSCSNCNCQDDPIILTYDPKAVK